MLEMSGGVKRMETGSKLAEKGGSSDQKKPEGLFTIVESIRKQGTGKKSSMIMNEEEIKTAAAGSQPIIKEPPINLIKDIKAKETPTAEAI
jgi:hypothetical protein